tara:strand:+ start:2648 stop:3565 length:918 start_codon:yes stop_codon:yes gene_type:complete
MMASILIFIVFGLIFFGLALAALAKDIEQNWPKYKCNPAIMPFAGTFGKDAGKNFVECIGDIQKGFMGYFLGPIYYVIDLLSTLGGDLMNSLNMIRVMIDRIRERLLNIFGNIFGFLFNIVTQFQLMIINVKDLLSKVLAVVWTITLLFQGAIISVRSTINGPIGDLLRRFGGGNPEKDYSDDVGECFHRNTKMKMKNGKYKKMSELNLGDKLFDGGEVKAILRIKGEITNPFYKIYSEDLKEDVLVSGTHFIKHPKTGKFIKVKDYEKATKTDMWDEELSCLVTSNNLIPVGELIFWDWEDQDL